MESGHERILVETAKPARSASEGFGRTPRLRFGWARKRLLLKRLIILSSLRLHVRIRSRISSPSARPPDVPASATPWTPPGSTSAFLTSTRSGANGFGWITSPSRRVLQHPAHDCLARLRGHDAVLVLLRHHFRRLQDRFQNVFLSEAARYGRQVRPTAPPSLPKRWHLMHWQSSTPAGPCRSCGRGRTCPASVGFRPSSIP